LNQKYLAHSANDFGQVDTVRDHLLSVAHRAAEFASAFDAQDEAFLTGLLHDLGKYGDLFQRRLEGKARKVDHWSAGAWIPLQKYQIMGVASCLAIQGHHLGLQRASKDAIQSIQPKKLSQQHPLGLRLSEPDEEQLLLRFAADGLNLQPAKNLPASIFDWKQTHKAAAMHDVRMLFSTLVDADFIETEAHFTCNSDGSKRHRKDGPPLNPGLALLTLHEYIKALSSKSEASENIRGLRSDLLAACLSEASKPTGLFTLTAPTGAGKTLSMLAFALRHAELNGLRRIIIVIPYLSIIDQTVHEYRKVFQDSSFLKHNLDSYILEDHSLARARTYEQSDSTEQPDMDDSGTNNAKLLAENWDAPIIITTSVQFFESLFSNRPGACRKLHRMARSLILFDEVQTFPVSLAVPTLATLSNLTARYGSSVVFSTATQPAFEHLHKAVSEHCASGWEPMEIVPRELRLFSRANRTRVAWPSDVDMPVSWSELANQLCKEKQVLCIVNLKRHALKLFEELRQLETEGLCHLSTSMCPAHRRSVLEEIKSALKDDKPIRVVSTQCVEAGVDLDFPKVFRAWGPLDAISQAAGRCNREGKANFGDFHVFIPEEEEYPDPTYAQAASVARVLLKMNIPQELGLESPELFRRYFSQLYDLTKPENLKTDLKEALTIRDFPEVAKNYKIIAQDSINVLVPYSIEKYEELKDELHDGRLTRKWINKARPYCIGLFRPRHDAPVLMYLEAARVNKHSVSQEWFIYTYPKHYDPALGLLPPDPNDCLIA
jgi:CRISPR-associated endonuclease/helicase Cas3